MTPEQYDRIIDKLGEVQSTTSRIEQKIDSHIIEDSLVHQRQDAALTLIAGKVDVNTKTISRLKGIGAGAGTVLTFLVAALGLKQFGG